MSDRFSIDVGRRTVGIAVRSGDGFRFFAAKPGFFPLDGKSYPHIRAVFAATKALAERQGHASPAADTRPVRRKAGFPTGAKSFAGPFRSVSQPGVNEPPEWFPWAVYIGFFLLPLILAALATAHAG